MKEAERFGAPALSVGELEHFLRTEFPQVFNSASGVSIEKVWHGGALLLRLRDEACCPVVLLAQGPSRRLLDEAGEGGVMACLIEPVRAIQLASTLDLAVTRFRELQGLRQALADRKVIERAKGLLMAQEGLTEDEAFRRLRRSAMDTQRLLADTARAVLRAQAVAASV